MANRQGRIERLIGGLHPRSRIEGFGSKNRDRGHDWWASVSRFGDVGLGYLSRMLLLQRKIASLMVVAVTVDILLRGDPYCVLRVLCS